MKIAILTSGILPVPAVQGGAVEMLADHYLEYNNRHKLHDITVYSVYHPKVDNNPILQSDVNLYRYIDVLNNNTLQGSEIYQSADRILTVSDYIRNRVATCNEQDKKTITVHNGIDLGDFTRPSSITRKQTGCKADDFILVFSGRLIPEKGIMELVEAMKMLKEQTRIKLLVIGSSFFDNSQMDDAFISELKSTASEMGDRIVFTGYVEHEQMPDYLKLADVAVIPSIWNDPFPTTILEGMAAGLPIITTDRGGIPEMVTKDNAIVLPFPGDFTGNLAKAILSLYNDKEGREYMGNVSRILSRRYSKEIYAKNFFDALTLI